MAPPPFKDNFGGERGAFSAWLAPKPPGDQNQKSNLEGAVVTVEGFWFFGIRIAR